MTRLGVAALLTLGVVATVVEVILTDSMTGDLFYLAAAVPLCCLGWWGATRRRPDDDRRSWVLFALMQTVSVAGDAVQTWQVHHGGAPLAGPSDVLWLSTYPFQTVALIRMARRRAPGQLRAASLD